MDVHIGILPDKLVSNTVYDIIKRFRERGNFVCGRRTRRLMTGMTAYCIAEAEVCMAAKLEFCRFPPNGEYKAGGACL